jgi:hypothetical protein
MSLKTTEINVGSSANDGTGDGIRSAFQLVNENFSNVVSIVNAGVYSAVTANTIQANVNLISLGVTSTQVLTVAGVSNFSGAARFETASINSDLTVGSIITPAFSTQGNISSAGLTVSQSALIGKNLVVVGNLTVLGNSVSINSADLSITDSVIRLHNTANQTPLSVDDGKDIGVVFHYYQGASRTAALVWANDSQAFEFYAAGVESAANTFSGTYGNLKIGSLFTTNAQSIVSQGNISTTGYLLGNLQGSAARVGTLTVTDSVQGSLFLNGADRVYINGDPVITASQNFRGGVVPDYTQFSNLVETRGNLYANNQTISSSVSTGALVVAGGVGVSGALNVGGAVTGNRFTGAGTGLTGLATGLSVGGSASVVTSAAQPAITSVGTLSGLVVAGNVSASTVYDSGSRVITAASLGNYGVSQIIAGTNSNINPTDGTGSVTINVNNNWDTLQATNFSSANVQITGGSIPGVIITGTVNNASSAGIVTTAAQPAITSVGTLSALNVTGNISAARFTGIHNGAGTGLTGTASGLSIGGSAASAGTAGTVTSAAQPTITSVGTLSSLAVTEGITAASFTGTHNGAGTGLTGTASGLSIGGSAASAGTAGSAATVTNSAQPNITSLGTLSSLTVGGSITAGGFNGSGSALTGIPNTALVNSSLTINGTPVALGGAVNVGAAASALTGTILAAGVLSSSLTSVGTLANLTVTGNILGGAVYDNGSRVITSASLGNYGVSQIIAGTNTTVNPAAGTGMVTVNVNNNWVTLQATNFSSANVQITGGSVAASTVSGTVNSATTASSVTSAAQPAITSVGTLTSLSVTGGVSAGTFNGSGAGLSGTASGLSIGGSAASAGTASTVSGSNQPNITSVGTLTSLSVTGNVTAANFNGVASSAKYADLAENYVADAVYPPGTVLIFGGTAEVTQTSLASDTRVAGVVSTLPAYLMNSAQDGVAIALRGRVPCQVLGSVQQGDLLVTSALAGYAESVGQDRSHGAAVFAKALTHCSGPGTNIIEVVIL